MAGEGGDNSDRRTAPPRLSFVVATRNRLDVVRKSLARLRTVSSGLRFEIIVVDDASDGDDVERLLADGLADQVVRTSRNLGVDAFNAGAACARGQYLVILDDDAWPDSGAVARAMHVLDREPRLGAVALHPNHPDTKRSEWPFVKRMQGPVDDWPLIGPGSVVRASVWQSAGGYEAAYFLYSNDTDFALKLLGMGWGVYMDPAFVVWHDCPTIARRPRRWFRLAVRNRIWTARRHAGGLAAWKYGVASWLEAHLRAGFDPSRHANALLGAACGVLQPAPALTAGLKPGREGMARLFTLRAGRAVATPSNAQVPVTNVDQRASHLDVLRVTALIPSFGRHTDVTTLLGDLLRLRLGTASLDVIVIDNASEPPLATMEVPTGLSVEFLRLKSNRGGSGGFNAGIGRALRRPGPPDAVWLLDSDVRVARGALAALLEALRGRPALCAAGSAMHDPLGSGVYEIGGRVDRKSGRYHPAARGRHAPRTLIDAEYLAATSLLVRASAIERVGLMPNAFLNGDDVEWTIRLAARTQARLVGVPRSVIAHPMGQSPTLARYYQSRNALRPARAAGLSRRARVARVTLEAGRAFAMAVLGRRALAALHVRGLRDGFGGVTPAHPDALPRDASTDTRAGAAALAKSLGTLDQELVYLHPRLRLPPAARENLAASLATEGLPVLARRVLDTPPGELHPLACKDLGRGLARLLLGPTRRIAIAPLDEHPSVWGCARTVLLVWPGGAVIVDGRWRRRSLLAGVPTTKALLYGLGLALRYRGNEPLPSVGAEAEAS
jgi:GT2 family glycosyltransferase